MKWADIDSVSGTIRITPEKGSNPRLFKLSNKLTRMLSNLPRTSERIWIYKNADNLAKGLRRQRKRVVHKLGNPRILQIHCHTLRHWKATMEYAKTKDILYVQKLLGHRSLKTTLRYTQFVAFPQDEEYVCKTAKTVNEAKRANRSWIRVRNRPRPMQTFPETENLIFRGVIPPNGPVV